MKTKVVIAEDHTILRDGLRSMLTETNEFDVLAGAKDGLEAIGMSLNMNPNSFCWTFQCLK